MAPAWLPVAHRLHVAGMAVGTALLTFLVYRLLRVGLARRYPCFLAFLAIAIARAVQGFVGISDGWYVVSEGATMAAKTLAVLEGFVHLYPRPRLPTMGLLGGLAAILAGITLLLPGEPNPVREFERYRTAAHVGLAAFTAAGCGWLWIRPRPVDRHVMTHWRIWTFRLACMAALGVAVNYQAWPEELRWVGYYAYASGFLLSGYAASLMWIRWIGRGGSNRNPVSASQAPG